MLEFLITTLLFEKFRHVFKRKPRNNKKVILQMERDMPTFSTVGELRVLLTHFADDVPTRGGFGYPLIQVRSDMGTLFFGSSSQQSEKKYG